MAPPLLISVIASFCLLSFVLSNSANAEDSIKLYGKVDELATACANAGIKVSGTKFPLQIEKVRLGSPAYYGGVRDSDVLLSGIIDKTRMKLMIQRNGKTYAVNIAIQANSFPLRPIKPVSGPEISLTADKTPIGKEIELLKNYDIAFVIDRSGSMNEPLQSIPQIKWQWCQSQIKSFAQEAESILPKGFTIFMFNDSYITLKNCAASDVSQCFQKYVPEGNTNMGDPLDEAMNLPRTSPKKDLLVVVLTDGLPNRGPDPKEIVIRNSLNLVDPQDTVVAFIEVGEEYPGRDFLLNMDTELVPAGAKYDLVRSVTFDQVKALGLTRTLIAVIKNQLIARDNTITNKTNSTPQK